MGRVFGPSGAGAIANGGNAASWTEIAYKKKPVHPKSARVEIKAFRSES